jgi:ribosome-associated protein
MDLPLLCNSIHKYAGVSFSRSGGPGGQNVNKVNTKVTLRLRLEDLAGLSEAEMNRLREVLAPKLSHADRPAGRQADEGGGGRELVLTASEERSQRLNLERVYARAEALVAGAARLPKRRRPTKPSRAARENRLKSKHLHGIKKTERRRQTED